MAKAIKRVKMSTNDRQRMRKWKKQMERAQRDMAELVGSYLEKDLKPIRPTPPPKARKVLPKVKPRIVGWDYEFYNGGYYDAIRGM